ncbi:DedA family protein [Tomitella gaofuii]|uniref:DedA family protein n=1 Tax=Tomitella gaofuii TaxID=2760083 RepID=UPI002E2B5D25|nr:DedA family protein [Tomitella gaofuii]
MTFFSTALDHVQSAGPGLLVVMVAAVLFVECAFLIGFVLPGDSLLATAGMMFAAGHQPGWLLLAVVAVFGAAVAGNHVGYRMGRCRGSRLAARPGGRFVNAENLGKARGLLNRYGFWGVLMARWLPWIRTLCPQVAGAAAMNRRSFAIATALGALVWAPVMLVVGYVGGSQLDRVRWLMPVVLGGMTLAVIIVTAVGVVRMRREGREHQCAEEAAPALTH